MAMITTLTESQLRAMYRRKQKWNAKNIKLLLPVPSAGAIIGVERITGEGSTVKGGNKIYPIHAKVLLFIANPSGKSSRIILSYWDDKALIGRNESPEEVQAALKRAEKHAYTLASRISRGGVNRGSLKGMF